MTRLTSLSIPKPLTPGATVAVVSPSWGGAAVDSLPVIGNLDFGHTHPIVTLPYGAEASLDCTRETVKIRP